jgi:hypothetical protein
VSPAFVASDFDVSTYTVVTSIADVTSAPTSEPTRAPTKTGFVIVEEEVETEAVVAAISFPLTLEEANNKVMQTAMTDGVAASLGLASNAVTISKINGDAVVPVVPRTRILASASGIGIEFNIVSASAGAGAVAKLSEDVQSAASGGALVANVQKKASDAGVLVASLKAMPRAVAVAARTEPVTITVTKQVAAAAAATAGGAAARSSAPTPSDSRSNSSRSPSAAAAETGTPSGLAGGAIAGIAAGAVALVSILAFLVHAHTKKATKPVPEGPVKHGKAEGALGGPNKY